MNFSRWISRVTAGVLTITLLSWSSVSTLAAQSKLAGEIIISDSGADVTVNGEVARTGRTIFSGSTIDTPKDSGALVLIGSLGRLELAPSTSVTLSFDDNGIVGTLSTGRLTVLSAGRTVAINGKNYGAGETAETASTTVDTTQSARASSGGGNWWVWVVLLGGGIAGIVLATSSSNSSSTGGGTTPVSPLR